MKAIIVGGRTYAPYTYLGVTGIIFGMSVASITGYLTGVPLLVILALIVGAGLTFYLLGKAAQLIAGEEVLVFYHYKILILATSALLLWCLDQPLFPALDLVAIAILFAMGFGRFGCNAAGCCFGTFSGCSQRAPLWAARKKSIKNIEFRIWPVQKWDAVSTLLNVTAHLCLFISDVLPSGQTLGSVLIAYALQRFILELFRGDLRAQVGPFSEAQVTATIITVVLICFHYLGWHALHPSSLVIAFTTTSLFVIAFLLEQLNVLHFSALYHTSFTTNLSELISEVKHDQAGKVFNKMVTPTLSVSASFDRLQDQWHFSASHRTRKLSALTAKLLAKKLVRAIRCYQRLEAFPGRDGIYHFNQVQQTNDRSNHGE